jgi:hypothetical protein
VVLGLLFAIPLGLLVHASSVALLRVMSESAAVGVTCAMIATGITRRSLRGTEKDTDRLLIALIVTLLLTGILTWMLKEWSIVAQALLGLWLLLLSISAASPSSRWNRLRREREQEEPSCR